MHRPAEGRRHRLRRASASGAPLPRAGRAHLPWQDVVGAGEPAHARVVVPVLVARKEGQVIARALCRRVERFVAARGPATEAALGDAEDDVDLASDRLPGRLEGAHARPAGQWQAGLHGPLPHRRHRLNRAPGAAVGLGRSRGAPARDEARKVSRYARRGERRGRRYQRQEVDAAPGVARQGWLQRPLRERPKPRVRVGQRRAVHDELADEGAVGDGWVCVCPRMQPLAEAGNRRAVHPQRAPLPVE
eukprot:CAMPEP_0118812398 /NCGR_PEP_ID=MMETSP1162-20130426/2267_1 /TAXON_ID=33656 /ORGANISM="Phaeocystis Sp, Strain CCMP2710" /LENGTH=246 /DNA_ID=CAMNT_0006742117 /DNA_START=85 /DNA_END=825 /DNA_ORIENTATION=+